MKFTQYVQKKILRLIGYKGHRVHTGNHVDPTFLGQKTCIFSQFHPLKELSFIEIFLGFLLSKFHENYENMLNSWISGTICVSPQRNAANICNKLIL